MFQRPRVERCCSTGEGFEPAKGVAEVEAATAAAGDPRELPTVELVAYIVSTHHCYLRQALPLIQELSKQVSGCHGERNPQLRTLDAAVRRVVAKMIPRLDEEERIVFPALLAAEPDLMLASHLDSIVNEHRSEAKLLEEIRCVSAGFALPSGACGGHRRLFAELERLERDTLAHAHLEGQVLLPRFAARAERLTRARSVASRRAASPAADAQPPLAVEPFAPG